MYAVVQTGGKQYRVTAGDYIVVERLAGENGDKIELNDILLLDNEGKVTLGKPFVKDALIKATIVDQSRARKIIVFKKKRRKNYRRKQGHRQHQTVLHVGEIHGDGKTAKAENTPKVIPVDKNELKAKAPVNKKVPAKKAEPKPALEKKTTSKPVTKKTTDKQPAAKKPAAKKATTSKKAEK